MIFLIIFLNIKSKHIIKGAIAQIEKKLGKTSYESNPSENLDMRKQKLNQTFSVINSAEYNDIIKYLNLVSIVSISI